MLQISIWENGMMVFVRALKAINLKLTIMAKRVTHLHWHLHLLGLK